MKSYVLVGVGGRSAMYTDALSGKFRDSAKLLALCDNNKGRMKLREKELSGVYPDLKCYTAEDFDKMVNENKPDSVIVCTRDSFHDEYICRALELGCDVITEKPMTTDEKKCQRIIDTVKKTGKNVRVTFNYRYSPPRTQIKKLLLSGVIGKVLSVEFQWLLDTNHGADYYRRWHRNKKFSGGLMVHKATHHFDLINWWISSYPESVFAKGDRVFYNEKQAKRYGLENHKKTLPHDIYCNLCFSLCDLFSNKAFHYGKEIIDDIEAIQIDSMRERLITISWVLGAPLSPKTRKQWEKEIALEPQRRKEHYKKKYPSLHEFGELLRHHSEKIGEFDDEFDDINGFDENIPYSQTAENIEPDPTNRKIGRNEPCYCGSGKKYKKCCGKNSNA